MDEARLRSAARGVERAGAGHVSGRHTRSPMGYYWISGHSSLS